MKAKNEISLDEYKILPKKRRHDEYDMQVRFFHYVSKKIDYDDKNPYNYIFAIPNGGNRDIKTARFLKLAGTMQGVPDVLCIYKTFSGLSGVAIEFKSKKGTLSTYQKVWMKRFYKAGYLYYVCRTSEEAILRIENTYMKFDEEV
jgi:hypothetical protein